MTAEIAGSVRVALLLHKDAPTAARTILEQTLPALRAAGVEPAVVEAAPLFEFPLRARGFTGPLTQVPRAVHALWRGRYDVAHAFSVPDVQAALLWRRVSGHPVVFGCTERLDRDRVADRRLRLQFLTAALEDTDAVVAADTEAREALWTWLAAEAPLIPPTDGAGLARLYRELIAQT